VFGGSSLLNGSVAGIVEGVGVLLSIFTIIFFIRRGWKMYTVLCLAVAILALTNGLLLVGNLKLLYTSLTSYTAFYLVSMVLMITLLGHLHQKIGAMEMMVDSLRRLIRDPRLLLMVFPASISLFSTVPGGAIISAPMVEETGRLLKMPPLELAMSNMVYRHLVVLITPFNSSLILISGLTGISIAGYLSFTVPVIIVVFLIATVLIFYRYPRSEMAPVENQEGYNNNALVALFSSAFPFLLAIFLGLVCGVFFPLALLAGIVACFFVKLPAADRIKELRARLKILLGGFNWPLILSTLAIVVYKDFMLEAEAFQQTVQYLVEQGLPLMVLIVVLPFITGFITGNNTASLGIAVPVLIPFFGAEMLTVRYFGLVYLSSYAGYFGSPVHLCTYLTNEYFNTPMYSLIKRINVYGAIMLGVGLILSFFY
jgi:uncharacterized protein